MNAIIGGVMAISLLIPNVVVSIKGVDKGDTTTEKSEKITIENADEPDSSSASSNERGEILWLARAIYSETKEEDEMHLIGWVIRNRVENKYWGDSTYKAVVTRRKQFSGLNASDPHYRHNMSLTEEHTHIAWQMALNVAEEVYYAKSSARPFSRYVQHFYSPEVVQPPKWADSEKLAFVSHDTNNGTVRFAFYRDVR